MGYAFWDFCPFFIKINMQHNLVRKNAFFDIKLDETKEKDYNRRKSKI